MKGFFMSGGSGGTSWTPSTGGEGSGEEDEEFDCLGVTISTRLQSPDADVLGQIDEGDILQVQIGKAGEEETPALIAVHEGNYAGSISHYSFQDILKCIGEGYDYEAEVRRIDGGLCQVIVRHI